jgi:hypothetical protein
MHYDQQDWRWDDRWRDASNAHFTRIASAASLARLDLARLWQRFNELYDPASRSTEALSNASAYYFAAPVEERRHLPLPIPHQ